VCKNAPRVISSTQTQPVCHLVCFPLFYSVCALKSHLSSRVIDSLSCLLQLKRINLKEKESLCLSVAQFKIIVWLTAYQLATSPWSSVSSFFFKAIYLTLVFAKGEPSAYLGHMPEPPLCIHESQHVMKTSSAPVNPYWVQVLRGLEFKKQRDVSFELNDFGIWIVFQLQNFSDHF